MMSAVIIGGASCIYDDLDRARSLFTPDLIIAVNTIGRDFEGQIDAICSTHSENIRGWLDEREAAGRPMPSIVIMNDTRKIPDELKTFDVTRAENYGGSSSQLAIMGALKRGIGRIVLCGCPMDDSAHYNDPSPWPLYHTHRYAWTKYKSLMDTSVRSCSGWTRELLGDVSQEWLSSV